MTHSKSTNQFDPSTLSGLTVAVQGPDGEEYEGTLVHFTGGTLKVQFWGDDLPAFGLTQPLSIFINGLNLTLPALPACAMERNELPGGRAYRFAYTLTPEFQSKIPEDLWVLFPSRASHRVQPSADAPVQVSLGRVDGGETFEARVVDISTSGVGLAVDRDTENHLHTQRAIRIHFQFPGLPKDENTTTIFGKVMHRRMERSELRYGVSFDLELELETVGQDALIRYIVAREK
ncbi:MAG: PilZ domain-containing protein [Planctomycetota bacterium]|nr:PilZ domain-containing protein [Planctomycetota bacterium]